MFGVRLEDLLKRETFLTVWSYVNYFYIIYFSLWTQNMKLKLNIICMYIILFSSKIRHEKVKIFK